MTDQPAQPFALEQISRPLSLLPVGLKEAALDSPTFRATAVHFSDQVQIVETWLEGYVRSTSRLIHDAGALEETINSFLQKSVPPANVSEAVLDHDYTLLAMQRFGEGSRDWWMRFLTGTRKMETTIVEPLKAFLNGELRNFKDARRYLEQSQKAFDGQLARYLGQSKGKEASALREDAFQVHEARKAYLKASLDFCLLVPQLRFTIDKLLVKVSTEQWKEMKKNRETSVESLAKWTSEMDRIKGWSKEMDIGESVFRRELQLARKEIGRSASNAAAPSRELEDYNISTVPFLGPKGPSINDKTSANAEKQSWLYLRSISGKPARTTWVRRWFYVKSGIFGWLVQGQQSGGVEESEKIGVLLCNVKPAPGEDRRFCFEVKTKNATLMLQAETQAQLMEWLEAFEIAKNNAIKASADDSFKTNTDVDPAFAITPPSVSEFAAKPEGQHAATGSEDIAPVGGYDRTNTLPVPGYEATRSSVDVTSGPGRRSIIREEGESGRDHAARIIQKLDLHRRSTAQVQDTPPIPQSPTVASSAMGGIASLIAHSHTILPTYAVQAVGARKKLPPASEWNTNSLAPSTLANPPAPTNLSKAAVIISAERGIGLGRSDATGGMPSGIMANLWGSTNWGYINRLGSPDEQLGNKNTHVGSLVPPSLVSRDSGDGLNESIASRLASTNNSSLNTSNDASAQNTAPATPSSPVHKKVMSMSGLNELPEKAKLREFPSNYPIELKTQEAQFRMLFTNVPKHEHVVLVFRATWNPNDQQEFPGRVYVTQENLYFYSHHMGLVLITSASLDTIDEVTAAPGKDCDFLFLHLKDSAVKTDYTRITIKTFLEPLKLLQARLNYLVTSRQQRLTPSLEQFMTDLIKFETDGPAPESENESWEEIGSPSDSAFSRHKSRRDQRDLKRAIHVEGGLHPQSRAATKFQLPSQPIVYVPEGMERNPVERVFEISPKSLFHVMFGDKSAVFQLLYHERRAQRIAQGPWVHLEHGHMQRDFSFQIDYVDMFRRQRQANVVDYQIIEVLNDHVCYVITDKKTPWHLPHHENFMLITKIVITHVAKSRCKLSIYNKVEWSNKPRFSKALVEKHALDDLDLDAMDLADVVADQVRKLGPGARTKKAVQIFGHVGQQTSVSLFSSSEGQKKGGKIQQRTLGTMLWERTSSFLETAVSSVMMWIFAALKWLWKIASANSILLSLLILSAAVNLFMSGKDASEWWKEREAASFMERLGIKPNMVMSRAVHVADLPSAVSYTSPLETLSTGLGIGQEQNRCLQTFQSISNTTDLSAPYELAGVGLADKNTRSTARRIRRSRQQLGSYRHDLLVAMRVVNRIEGEMISAEWENWLVGEVSRCASIREAFSGEKGQKLLESKKGRERELIEWQRDYCGSCKAELDRVGGQEEVGKGMF